MTRAKWAGSRYFTDGELAVGVLVSDGTVAGPVVALPSPTPVVIEDQFWSWLRPALASGG